MPPGNFHSRPFDEGTLTKLEIVELYAREWLPVFLSSENPPYTEIHLYDFFAGPGTDSGGVLGSPLRLLTQLKGYRGHPGWGKVAVQAHFFDGSASKIRQLEANISSHGLKFTDVGCDLRALTF